MNSKTLYKTDENSVIGGVCAGISEVYGFDVSIVRIITLVLFLIGAPLIIYIVMWIVLPEKKDVVVEEIDPKDDYTVENDDYYY